MDINLNSSAALAQNATGEVGIAVLKKSIDIQSQAAMTLISAIPQPQQQSAANLPPNLGQNINITA